MAPSERAPSEQRVPAACLRQVGLPSAKATMGRRGWATVLDPVPIATRPDSRDQKPGAQVLKHPWVTPPSGAEHYA